MKLPVFLIVTLSILSSKSVIAHECVDTGVLGDGWGWDGFNSCRIDTPAFECVDTDGDGWGWNGVDSCMVDVKPNVSRDNVLYRVLPTGLTTSYIRGDDADQQTSQITASRFKDNNNGTFTDDLTGLTWLGLRQCIFEQTWSSGINFTKQLGVQSSVCAELNDGSIAGDWRLPNINELQSLVDYQKQSPVFAGEIPYTGTWDSFPWGRYWSSTSFVVDPTQNAWILNADFGQIEIYRKENVARVFAVRD